jgi:hypothetical protein
MIYGHELLNVVREFNQALVKTSENISGAIRYAADAYSEVNGARKADEKAEERSEGFSG